MSIPGFNADASLRQTARPFRKQAAATPPANAAIAMQAMSLGSFGGFGGFGGFGPTCRRAMGKAAGGLRQRAARLSRADVR